MLKETLLNGYYAHVDGFGRLFFDKCATEEEHLLNTNIPEGDDRPRCRVYAQDLLPLESQGKKGVWSFNIFMRPEDK